MGLKEKLKSIFKGEDNKRINDMVATLKRIKVFTEDDLIHLDKDILKDTGFFGDIEIKKLLCAKPGEFTYLTFDCFSFLFDEAGLKIALRPDE